MADTLAAGFNVFAGTWLEGSGPAQIELLTIDWLKQACGFPEGAGGLFVSGGSMANLTALAVARTVKFNDGWNDVAIYCSDQTHSSILRGLKILGFRSEQIRVLDSDENFRLDPQLLRAEIQATRSAGQTPFCIIANAGTTNSGAIDPLPELAQICRVENLWLHVDGAYGAAAVLCERGRTFLHGLQHADSLSLDPHKWLFQPYEIGCVLVRETRWLTETFHILPEYLADTQGKEGEVNFCDRGVQLTRSFRALKLWMSLKVFGRKEFEAAMHRGFELAETAATTIRALPNWEIVTPAQLGVVTFRCAPPNLTEQQRNDLSRELAGKMMQEGYAMISTTMLKGKTVLRMCTINPRTSEAEIQETIHRLDRMCQNS
jgi:glutamate/tyrosine decarboxylase-like PLP-dependent enzyme